MGVRHWLMSVLEAPRRHDLLFASREVGAGAYRLPSPTSGRAYARLGTRVRAWFF